MTLGTPTPGSPSVQGEAVVRLRLGQVAQLSKALRTRFRLLLFGHEDLVRIVFWAALVGFCAALASVAFREGIRLLELAFTGQSLGLVHGASRLKWWHRALVPVVGGVLAGYVLYLSRRAFFSARAVDYMEAVLVGDGRISARATLSNALSSLLTIASGGSIGREGPMVQLAAMLGSKLGKLDHAPLPRRRLMVACGGAAGIAAAYNAPISGALFVAEIVLGSMAMESFGPLVVASVISSATIHRFLGYGPVYDVPPVQFGSNWELFFFVILGVILGHLAPPFLALLDFAKARFAALDLKPPWKLGLGGLIVGAISILAPQVWGNGYSVVGDILHHKLFGLWLLGVLAAKILATSATVGSGAIGGVFTPTLFIGCAIGGLAGGVVHGLLPTVTSMPAAYALVGMGGFLAATTQAPLTSILMLFEMTGDYQLVMPLMLACVSAHFVAKVYRKGKSVYHAHLHGALSEATCDDWRVKNVAALLRPASAVASPGTSLAQLLDRLPNRVLDHVYLVNDEDELVSWLDAGAALAKVSQGTMSADAPLSAFASPVTLTVTPDMSLGAALDIFLRERATVLPVTSGEWRGALLGEVSRQDVFLAIQDRLTYPK